MRPQSWRKILSQFARRGGNQLRTLRLVVLALVFSAYAIFFYFLYPLIGDGAAILAALPVIVAGWLYGPWQGIAGGVVSSGITFLLIFRTGGPGDTPFFIVHYSIETIFLILLGGFLGSESKLRYRLRVELLSREKARSDLEQSEARYRSLFENSADGIFLMDERFLDCNEQACKMFACPREDIIGRTQDEFSPEFQPNGMRSHEVAIQWIQAAVNGVPQSFPWQHLRRDGTPIDVEISLSAIQFPERTLLLAVLRDMTKKREIERSEQDQRNLAEALIEVAAVLTSVLDLDEVLDKILASANRVVPHDGANIALVNSEMVIVRVARASTPTGHRYTYGSGPDTFTGTPVRNLDGLARMASTGLPLVISDTLKYPGWVVFPESAWVRSYVGVPIIVQGRTVGFINLDSAIPGFYQPVHGERLRAFANLAAIAIHNAGLYERAQEQAVTDELTGLYNRRGLMSVGQIEVERSLRYAHPLAVLMIDVDNFKQVNDRSGYRAGDEVLRLLAKRCRQCLRSIDIAGRYGGDEFVFVLPESTMEGAIKVAERLRFSVDSDLFATTAEPLRISISIGAAVLTPPQSSFAQLLEQAGAALHAAKFAGKNRVAG